MEVGAFFFQDYQWASYSATSKSWKHGMVMEGLEGTPGPLEHGFTATISSACDRERTVCSASSVTEPDPQIVPIVPGGTYYFEWTETDEGPASKTKGKTDVLDRYLGVHIDGMVNTPQGPAEGSADIVGVLAGRCDSVVTTKDGCVDEDFWPTLSLSQKLDGAAADMIKWAQHYLSGHWGLHGSGQPLHRLIGGRKNRYVICRKGWKADATITKDLAPFKDKDSCDEFPFAASYESGAMMTGVTGKPKPHVSTGADCAQVTAVEGKQPPGASEATVWNTVKVDGKPSKKNPCVRGHIPTKLNVMVGVAYSVLIRTQRLINKDAFWLAVGP